MHLLNVAALALLSGSLALAALNEARDEWQPSADSLACLYMTNDYDWAGEGQNLCEVGGQCGEFQSKCLVHSLYDTSLPLALEEQHRERVCIC